MTSVSLKKQNGKLRPYAEVKDEAFDRLLGEALKIAPNIREAAKMLGIPRSTFYRYMNETLSERRTRRLMSTLNREQEATRRSHELLEDRAIKEDGNG